MTEERAPEGEPEIGKEGQFAEKLVLVNPNVIENYWKEGEKPHCYFKKWRYLSLHLEGYEFLRTYRSLDTGWDYSVEDIIEERREQQGLEPDGEDDEERAGIRKRRQFRDLERRARENFDALSEEEQSKFQSAHFDDLEPAKERQSLELVGWAEIERSRSIEVFSVATKEKADKTNYRKIFHRLYLSIQEQKDDAAGRLFVWDEDMRRFDDDDPGEDYLGPITYGNPAARFLSISIERCSTPSA